MWRGLNYFWCSSENIIRKCVRSAMDIVNREEFNSVAFPVIGSKTGGVQADKALGVMKEELGTIETQAEVEIVKFTQLTYRP